MEYSVKAYIINHSCTQGSGNTLKDGRLPKDFKSQRVEGLAVRLCLLSNIRRYVHKVSITSLYQHELNKYDMSEQDEVEGEKLTKLQPYTKNYRQVRKIGTNGRTHQLVAQCQMVSHENIYTNNIIGIA